MLTCLMCLRIAILQQFSQLAIKHPMATPYRHVAHLQNAI
ncbi:hypothetical protein EC2762100_2691 [Escherichia coli 2762100]|nr:hypothetical protein EC2762100_2691 [Escherichia coli 2762100]